MKIQSLRGFQPHNTLLTHTNTDVCCTGLCPGTSVKGRDWLEIFMIKSQCEILLGKDFTKRVVLNSQSVKIDLIQI